VIVAQIDEVLRLLSEPLAPNDLREGWTENIRQNWYKGLSLLKDNIQTHSFIDYGLHNTARALGMDGIDKGVLAERIARIGNLVMKMES
jgi:hypothetical protein